MPATPKALVVDEDAFLLEACAETLRGQLDLVPCDDPEEALAILGRKRGYCVVLAGDELQGMGGVELLKQAAVRAPEVVRVLLSNTASVLRVSQAVNEAGVFRFLPHPADPTEVCRVLSEACDEALKHQGGRSEGESLACSTRELLIELLSTARPEANARANRLRDRVVLAFKRLGVPRQWEIEAAAEMCQIGWANLPSGSEIEELHTRAYEKVAKTVIELSASLLSGLPGMEKVTEIIRHQDIAVDRARAMGHPVTKLGVQVLGLALELDRMVEVGATEAQAGEVLHTCESRVDPRLLDALSGDSAAHHASGRPGSSTASGQSAAVRPTVRLNFGELDPGQVIAEDLLSGSGTRLLIAGVTLTRSSIERLASYRQLGLLGANELAVFVDSPDLAA